MVRRGHAFILWAAESYLRFLQGLGWAGHKIRAVLQENTASRRQEAWLGSHCDGLSEEPGVLAEGSDSAQGEERAEPSLEGRDRGGAVGTGGLWWRVGRRPLRSTRGAAVESP